jgi:hypothetical protein
LRADFVWALVMLIQNALKNATYSRRPITDPSRHDLRQRQPNGPMAGTLAAKFRCEGGWLNPQKASLLKNVGARLGSIEVQQSRTRRRNSRDATEKVDKGR